MSPNSESENKKKRSNLFFFQILKVSRPLTILLLVSNQLLGYFSYYIHSFSAIELLEVWNEIRTLVTTNKKQIVI